MTTVAQPGDNVTTSDHAHALLAVGNTSAMPVGPMNMPEAPVAAAFMRRAPPTFVSISLDAGSPELVSARSQPDPLMSGSRQSLLTANSFASRSSMVAPLTLIGTQPDRGDTPLTRFLIFISDSASALDLGQDMTQDGTPLDFRVRVMELVRDSLIASRLATFSPDPSHTNSEDGSAGGTTTDAHHHPAAAMGLGGQNADSDATFAVLGRASGNVPQGVSDASDLSPSDEQKNAANAIVDHLLAFGELASTWSALPTQFSSESTIGQTLGSVLHDVLMPRLAIDATALDAAMSDLFAQVDDLGVGLLGMLSDPFTTAEIALAAGVAAAGFVYRHWRGSAGRAETEHRLLLAARFINPPRASGVGGRETS